MGPITHFLFTANFRLWLGTCFSQAPVAPLLIIWSSDERYTVHNDYVIRSAIFFS